MKEWLIANLDGASITAVCGVIGSLCTAIISLINASRTRAQMKKLMDQAVERGSYAICPRCKEKVPLQDLEFHLSNGALDQNLNGVADEEENKLDF